MPEYIERDAAVKLLRDAAIKGATPYHIGLYGAARAIAAIPAADVRPVKRAKWIDMGDFISCSSCNATRMKEFESDYGKVMRLDARTNFCPNCGADMRETNDEKA